MNHVWMVNVVCVGQGGAGLSAPACFVGSKELADKKATEIRQAMEDMKAAGTIVMRTPSGPKKIMTVKELLLNLGIINTGVAVFDSDIEGELVVPTEKRIIIPGN